MRMRTEGPGIGITLRVFCWGPRYARIEAVGPKRIRYSLRLKNGRRITQSIDPLAGYTIRVSDPAALDSLTRAYTACATFRELVDAPRHYTPTILPRDGAQALLAHEYDRFQSERKDPRRAHTGRSTTFPVYEGGLR